MHPLLQSYLDSHCKEIPKDAYIVTTEITKEMQRPLAQRLSIEEPFGVTSIEDLKIKDSHGYEIQLSTTFVVEAPRASTFTCPHEGCNEEAKAHDYKWKTIRTRNDGAVIPQFIKYRQPRCACEKHANAPRSIKLGCTQSLTSRYTFSFAEDIIENQKNATANATAKQYGLHHTTVQSIAEY